MILVGILIAVVGILIVLSSRSITTLFHELGHAIPSLLFTEGDVIVYVGSYGDVSKSLHLTFGRLQFYLTFNFWGWNLGMCVGKGAAYYRQQMLIVLAGPLTSLLIAFSLLYVLIFVEAEDWVKSLCALFLVSSLWDFFVNIIPNQQAIKLHDGKLTHNDGYQLKRLWQESRFPDAYFEGLASFEENNFETALSYFYTCLESGFDQPIVKDKILACYLAKKEYQAALDFFLAEMKTQKMKPLQYEQLGDLFSQVQDYENALNCYVTYLHVHYQDEQVLSKKGQALLYLGELNLAMEEFNFALRVNEKYAKAYSFRGRVFISMKEWQKAEADLKKALALDDEDSSIHLHWGMYHEEMGEARKALLAYEKAKEKGTDFHGIDYKIANVQQELNRDH